MAQKATKVQAARNAASLNRLHLISLAVNSAFLLVNFLLSSRNLYLWLIFALPSLAIELWFERSARPSFNPDGTVRRAGEDLEAKGLTEWMWDITYWTWGCIGLATVLGNRAWWAWVVIPAYSAWLAWTTFSGARSGLQGLGGASQDAAPGGASAAGQSKRQAKMEKREKGGQRVAYR
nr:hypothetical protein B0A51_07139 [Rachicladosporium sp. CCFEE 5018]